MYKNLALISMSKAAIQFNEQNFECYTPKYIVDMFGSFDYDPATTKQQAIYLNIPNYDTIDTNGLLTDWTPFKKIWINPPFNLKYEFLQKAVQIYKIAKNEIYFLSPISFLTAKKFHQIINGLGIKLYIPNGRIKFRGIYQEREETPPFGCVIMKLQSQNEIKFFNIVVPGQYSILNETDL